MTLIVSVDPGNKGALCLYDVKLGKLEVFAMPTYKRQIGKKYRETIDEDNLVAMLQTFRDFGATHLFVEKVQGLPGQSAPAAFVFGYGYAVIITAARMLGFVIERVTPSVWKASLRVPADKKAARARASEMIPTHKHLWPMAGDDGKAEAAMLALWGAKKVGVR